ncbi:MAG: PspC domain-containing protein [Rikenellaceae bacterium]|nr:PspC domain-containing protein [Rikenellaceae bacterium]
MKETLNVNVGSSAFTIDLDAYDMLKRYLSDISRRLEYDRAETMNDVERRIAEIFSEKITSSMQVVDVETVKRAMAIIGRPEVFGEPREAMDAPEEEFRGRTSSHRRFYRSRSDRSIAGICGGLAEYLGCDAGILRLVTLILIVFGGLSIWIYIILWLVIPEKPAESDFFRPQTEKRR